MLLYKNGRFYSEKVSFQLPDDFYLEDDPDITCECGLFAWSPRKDYLCSWRFQKDCEGTAAELQRWFTPDFGFVPLSEITALELNGLSGHFALYQNRKNQYYEARFDLGDGEELVFWAEARGLDIRQVAASPEFMEALGGIRRR